MNIRLRILQLGLILALILGLVLVVDGNTTQVQRAQAQENIFIVNSASDEADADPNDGQCLTSAGECTLRAAITHAQLVDGNDVIRFADDYRIVSSGGMLISDTSASITIDATDKDVVFEGFDATTVGVTIESNDNVVQGMRFRYWRPALQVYGFNNRIGHNADGTNDDLEVNRFESGTSALSVLGSNHQFRGNTFINHFETAVFLGAGSNIIFANNNFENNQQLALELRGIDNSSITNNNFDNDYHAIEVGYLTIDVTLTGNEIVFTHRGITIVDASNTTLEDNFIYASSNADEDSIAIYITGRFDSYLVDNIVDGNDRSYRGIYIDNVLNQTILERNAVFGSKTNIRVEGSGNTQIINNIVGLGREGEFISSTLDTWNISITSSPGVQVIGNVVSSGVVGIKVSNTNTFTVRQNFVGTDIKGDREFGNSGTGISLSRANNGQVLYNLVAGNGGHGISIFTPSTGNNIENNVIGFASDGLSPLGNELSGIFISGSTVTANSIRFNTIGNSGNAGIWIQNGAANNQIANNIIGMGNLGNTTAPNRVGIYLGNANPHTIESNIIAGNQENGIVISNSHEHSIFSNSIGGSFGITREVPTRNEGIARDYPMPSPNINGGTSTIAAGNGQNGILIHNGSSNNRIGNAVCSLNQRIGDARDTGDAADNLVNAFDSDDLIYYALCGEVTGVNIIRDNGNDGVNIEGDDSLGNRILINSIFDNGDLAIDLVGNEGVTVNDGMTDSDGGPNLLYNAPVLNFAGQASFPREATAEDFRQGKPVTIHYNAETVVGGDILFFISPTCDDSGHGEMRTFLGSAPIGSGLQSRTFITNYSGSGYITAVATRGGQEGTSEVSNCKRVLLPERGANELAQVDNELTSEDQCLATTIAEPTNFRTGPSESRTVFYGAQPDLEVEVIGQVEESNGNAWWQVNNNDIPNGFNALQLWVNQTDVTTTGDCDVPMGDPADPIARPTATPAPVAATAAPPSSSGGGDSGPACYSVSTGTTGEGSGSVSVTTGTNCPGGFTAGTTVTVSATANPGSVFQGWGGSCGASGSVNNGGGTASFTIGSNCSVTGQFVFIN